MLEDFGEVLDGARPYEEDKQPWPRLRRASEVSRIARYYLLGLSTGNGKPGINAAIRHTRMRA